MAKRTRVVRVPAGAPFRIFYDGVQFTITDAYGRNIAKGFCDGTLLGYKKLTILPAKR